MSSIFKSFSIYHFAILNPVLLDRNDYDGNCACYNTALRVEPHPPQQKQNIFFWLQLEMSGKIELTGWQSGLLKDAKCWQVSYEKGTYQLDVKSFWMSQGRAEKSSAALYGSVSLSKHTHTLKSIPFFSSSLALAMNKLVR